MTLAVTHDRSLQHANTLATPATAAHWVELHSDADLEDSLQFAVSGGLPLVMLGEGSNVVLPERLEALVVRDRRRGRHILETTADHVDLRVAAGENWHELVSWCLQQGYHGLENLALIPGTVGAAPIQNIGAYGVEIADLLLGVTLRYVDTGKIGYLATGECEFGYRDSVFKHHLRDRVIVESVDIRLKLTADPVCHYPSLADYLSARGIHTPGAADVYDAVVAIRRKRLPDPKRVPNAGSFFKNPVVEAQTARALLDAHPSLPCFPQPDGGNKLAAAWLIEQCGFKRSNEPVHVHPQHALVIVNPERRPGAEVQRLARRIQRAVADRFSIALEQEPRSYV